MKKQLFLVFAGLFFFLSCQKPVTTTSSNEEIASEASGRDPKGIQRCASYEVLEKQLIENPSLRSRMDEIEKFTQQVMNNPQAFRLVGGVYEIPVVFNVLYNTNAQNVSDAQLTSQLTVLNDDFGSTNSDISKVPANFVGAKAGNINIRFVPGGATIRKYTSNTSWSTNDAMKKTAQGGIDPTDPATILNIWVCNMGGGILGYAQFPGGSSSTDGVVLDDEATGSTGTAKAPYGKGRTATHEVGHWLNLRHIWGDRRCGTDYVNDTPEHDDANYGCPALGHKSLCKSKQVEMTMNYMDYTYDECMYMFSAGQKTRMLATFGSGGGRNSFAQP